MSFLQILAVGKTILGVIKVLKGFIEEANDIYDEVSPEIKSGKEKLQLVLDDTKDYVVLILGEGEEMFNKISAWIEKRVRKIITIYNKAKKFTSVEDRVSK